MIVIVDYGMGNLGSVANMLKKIGYPSLISSDKTTIEKATKLILPGVGAFDSAMLRLRELGLVDLLNLKVKVEKVPVLGICLGMQLLANKSEEGGLEKGFGWIQGELIKFRIDKSSHNIRIPHMGWNVVNQKKKSRLFENMFDENRFYFVHSYHYITTNPNDVLLSTQYGYEITAAVESDNILGVQFHPEKSHKFGMQLLKNFVENY